MWVNHSAGHRELCSGATLPSVVSVMMVNLLFMTVYAILGVELFAGRFGSCVSAPGLPSRGACLAAGEVWRKVVKHVNSANPISRRTNESTAHVRCPYEEGIPIRRSPPRASSGRLD